MSSMKIVKLSDCQSLNNLSAAFWDDVDATPENFNKTLSDGDYKTIALYTTKVIRDTELGISGNLKNKIVQYLRYHFLNNNIDDLFTSEEIVLAENTLLYLYNLSSLTRRKLFEYKGKAILSKTTELLKIKYKGNLINEIEEDNFDLAISYLKFFHLSKQQSEIYFSKDERQQANVVMIRVLKEAKIEKEKEIIALQKKLETILSF